MERTVRQIIKQRRAQMLIHSCLYYKFDTPIISDDKWQEWANELRDLQQNNPDDCKINFYDKHFKDWNGDTGFHLPIKDSKIMSKALHIKKLFDDKENIDDI